MKIQALIPFVVRDASTGEQTSYAKGQVATVSDEVGNQMISDGLAKEFTLITPTGSENITANGTYDITTKASVVVNVGTFTITYNANGGTGSVDAQTVVAGNSAELSDGAGLTAPETKTFGGWATTADAETADVESPYTPTANITLYAVWVAGE